MTSASNDRAADSNSKIEFAEPTEKKPLNPWLLVFGIPGTLFLIILTVLACVWLRSPPLAPLAPPVNECRMADGSILRVEAITVSGSAAATWTYTYRPPEMLGRFQERTQRFGVPSPAGTMWIWMSRRDESGRSLDFDWWRESVVVNAHNEEIPDYNPFLFGLNSTGLGGAGSGVDPTPRPLLANRALFDTFIVTSGIPAFRTNDGQFKLRVKDLMGNVVAEFELKHPAPVKFPEWTAAEYPVAQTSGRLGVKVNGIRTQPGAVVSKKYRDHGYDVVPDFDITWDGSVVSDKMKAEWSLHDALGNQWGVGLGYMSHKESAWQLKFKVMPLADAPADALQQCEFRNVEIPEPNSAQPLELTGVAAGINVRLLAIGQGSATYSVPKGILESVVGPVLGRKSLAFGFKNVGSMMFRVVGENCEVDVRHKLPHVLLALDDSVAEKSIVLTVIDDQRRSVPIRLVQLDKRLSKGSVQPYLMNPESDAKSVSLTVTVFSLSEFEMFVKPPKPSTEE